MRASLKRSLLGAALALAVFGSAVPMAQASADQQFFPLATYRVGAYASSGVQVWAGMIDYLNYINEVEGGINGVKLVWQECETEWTAEKGIECYERFKNGLDGAPVAVYQPNGAPAAYALSERAEVDKITLITLGYGRETLGPLKLLAERYGFENIQIPVADPGNEQSAQWRQIRQLNPDWVFLRTWGVSTPVAVKTAARFGFPVDHIVGDIWASSSEDVLPAGAAAKGYLALTPYPAGTDFEIHKRLKQYILDKGKSDLKDLKNFGSVYYNSGLVNAAVAVEAIRTAQGKFGKRPLNGEEGRWGLEHLNIDDARLKDMGYLGLMQNLKLSCKDHEGGGSARVQQWDGANWTLISDWIAADRALLRPLIDEKSAAFAKEKGLTPRTCTAEE